MCILKSHSIEIHILGKKPAGLLLFQGAHELDL